MNAPLKRNLILLWKNYRFNIFFLLFSIPIWTVSGIPMGSFSLTIPIMTYSAVTIMEQLEEYYKYGSILNSLPVTRSEVVKAKFHSILLIYLFNTVITLTVNLIYSLLGLTEFVRAEMFAVGLSLSFFSSMVYGAAVTALICKFGYGKIKLYTIIIYALTMGINTPVIYVLEKSNFKGLVSAVFIVSGIIVYLVSQQLSLKIYAQKEL